MSTTLLVKYRTPLLVLAMITAGILLVHSPVYGQTTGAYTSAAIGDARLSSFGQFSVIGQQIPDGASITYQFAGDGSNYERWSNPQAITDQFDLAQLAELRDSKTLKVRVSLARAGQESPVLEGFRVGYVTMHEIPDAAATPTIAVQESSGSENKVAVKQQATVSLANAGDPAPKSLVSTGGSLIVNLAIALVMSALVTWLIFRPRRNEQLETPPAPSPYIPPTEPPQV